MKRTIPVVLIAGALVFAACGSSSSSSSSSTTAASGAAPTTAAASASGSTTLTESGSSLLYPYLQVVAAAYHKSNPKITVNTAAGGSGMGISDATAGNTSFGGSDAYLSPSDRAASSSLQDIPIVVSSQAIDYNLAGIKNLKLTGQVLAEIYQGKITKWNDPAIAKLNAGVTLPSETIVPIHRSDSSGDTFLFTSLLSATDAAWAKGPSENTTISWPTVSGEVSAKGNPGMVQAAQSNKGSIAYIGISAQASAKAAGLGEALVQNKAGNFLQSSPATVDSAVKASLPSVPANLSASLIYASGANSYPIVNFEYIIVKDTQSSSATAAAIRAFLTYAISPTGGSSAKNLAIVDFEALPSSLLPKVTAAIAAIK